MQFQEYATIRNLQLDRGKILDIFSKLEFFVNEFIQAELLGLFSPKADYLGDILEYVDFFSYFAHYPIYSTFVEYITCI